MRRLALVLVLLAPLAACGGDDDAVVTATTTGLPEARPPVTVAVPTDFPSAVPLPAGVSFEELTPLSGEREAYDITGWFDGEPVAAARAYLAALDEEGFEVASRSEAADSLFFTAESAAWFVSAGFYLDPVRETGTSVGLTVARRP